MGKRASSTSCSWEGMNYSNYHHWIMYLMTTCYFQVFKNIMIKLMSTFKFYKLQTGGNVMRGKGRGPKTVITYMI